MKFRGNFRSLGNKGFCFAVASLFVGLGFGLGGRLFGLVFFGLCFFFLLGFFFFLLFGCFVFFCCLFCATKEEKIKRTENIEDIMRY